MKVELIKIIVLAAIVCLTFYFITPTATSYYFTSLFLFVVSYELGRHVEKIRIIIKDEKEKED